MLKKIMSQITVVSLVLTTIFVGLPAKVNAEGKNITAKEILKGNVVEPEINEINFPDDAFREVIREYDRDQDGKISSKDMAFMEQIVINDNKNIENIKGIEFIKTLKNFRVTKCPRIESINLTKNTNLDIVQIGFNDSLKEVIVSKDNENITWLEVIRSKNLESMYIDGLTNLDYLLCHNNENMKKLEVLNSNIDKLYAQENALIKFDLKNTKVNELVLKNNNLTALDLSKEKINYLLSSGNSLKIKQNFLVEELKNISGFDEKRVHNLEGGKIKDGKIIFNPRIEKITYNYDVYNEGKPTIGFDGTVKFTLTREINPPRITLDKDLFEIKVGDGIDNCLKEANIKAIDEDDGDITDKIEYKYHKLELDEDGQIKFDENGNPIMEDVTKEDIKNNAGAYAIEISVIDSDNESDAIMIIALVEEGENPGGGTVTPKPDPEQKPDPTPTPKPDKPVVPNKPTLPNKEPDRIEGDDRIETAIEASEKLYPNGTDKVVLANAERFSDVLTANPFAVQEKASALLTYKYEIPEKTIKEIERLGAKKIYVSGGYEAVSKKVVDELANRGYEIFRFDGIDRYDTARKIAIKIREKGNTNAIELASGEDFPDALCMTPLAVKDNAPILLTKKDSIPKYTKQALAEWDIENIKIGGLEEAVSTEVEKQIKSGFEIEKNNKKDSNVYDGAKAVKRIGGENRYETSAKLAKESYPESKLGVYATGEDFPDALIAGNYAGTKEAPVLLVKGDSLPEPIEKYTKESKIEKATIIGGVNAVSDKVFNLIKELINK